MTNWTSRSDVKSKMLKSWDKGLFLTLEAIALFPFRIKLKKPMASQLQNDFSAASQWATSFADNQHYFVERQEINHRKLGRQSIPVSVVFSCLDDVLDYLHKQKDYQRFVHQAECLLQQFPDLSDWVDKYPFKLLDNAAAWDRLIRVTHWMLDNPQPNIYIRQMKLKEIDTKFIEAHKKVLSEWWDILLSEDAICQQYTGQKQFDLRYGFKAKPLLIRFRLLDEKLAIHGLMDLSITEQAFSVIDINVDTVFVTENDVNALAFPAFPKALVLFGRGYGFEYLKNVNWLKNKRIIYWGDIDTHGFAILNQFRQYFSQTESLLMDEQTLIDHRKQWVTESKQTMVELDQLNTQEHKLYNQLRFNQIGEHVRLEQELVEYRLLQQRLDGFLL